MRDALNNNPKVQAGVIVFLILVGVLMFMRMSSSGPEPPASDPSVATGGAPATTGTGAGAVTTDGGAATSTAPTTATATAATPVGAALPSVPASATTTVAPKALVPGPGLPADVVRAFARGDAIVLLIVKDGAIDDDLVRDSVNSLSESGVTVFVSAASDIARYSRITQGVGVSRVPALVAIRPRKRGGDAPEAFVVYGFRTAQGVIQAARDALYGGREDIPYHPG